MTTNEPVKDALDHLLETLDLSHSNEAIVQDEHAAYACVPVSVSRSHGWSDVVALHLVRMRRSTRLRYKIPRLLIRWTMLIIGVCGLIWITLGAVGLR